ncbi:uncharacterized protein H6S33_006479 [Morchella sextelata]|uniref:uncharacterized protein n=1 Tax=Morchella sextelata TaxID=1174677 RepID=UPI001D0464D3|nr:uncharacterized protein H6S33_006479 [Morchella sextelata]KAH0604811.1 hypothetical protein H6S33_006479 [Morchella sextelata]
MASSKKPSISLESDTANSMDPPNTPFVTPANSWGIQADRSSAPPMSYLEAARLGEWDILIGILLGQDNKAIRKLYATEALPEVCRAGNEGSVEMLLKLHADVNAPPAKCGRNIEDKMTEVYEQDECGKAAACRRIACGRTALQAAAEGGHTRVLSLLIERGAHINAPPQGQSGRTALQAAAGNGHTRIVSELLERGANVNDPPAIHRGRTALQAAAESGNVEVVSMILRAGGKVNAYPSILHGRTALQAAADGGQLKIVLMLLEAKADVNALPAKNSFGRTALQAAAGNGHAEIVSVLLKSGAKVNSPAVGYHGRTALQAAAERGHLKVVSMLLKVGANVNDPPSRSYGRTALQAAAANGNVEILLLLKKAGALLNAPPSESHGRTVIQAAAENGHAHIISMTLNPTIPWARIPGGVDIVNAPPSEYDGMTALQAAAGRGHDEIVSGLLEAGAKVNATPSDNYGRTALQAAAENGYSKTVSILLKAGAEVNFPPAKFHGRTALQAATAGGYAEIAKQLLSTMSGRNLYSQALSFGKKPLWIAARKGHHEVVEILLKHGFDYNEEVSGKVAIRAAAEAGHVDVVELILSAGFDVRSKDSEGGTCLHWNLRHPDVVRVLLRHGADVHAQDFDGDTPLHCAVRFQNAESLVLLLENGANTEPRNYEYQTPLDLILQDSGNPSIKLARPLFDKGCSIKGRTRCCDIDFVTDYSLELPSRGSKIKRRLYSATDTSSTVGAGLGPIQTGSLVDRFKFFPSVEMLGIKRMPGTNSTMIKWSWSWIFPNSERNQSGVNLPGVGKLFSAVDRQVIVTCHVCFEVLVHIPDSENEKASGPNALRVGKSFQTTTRGSEVSWTMLKPETIPDADSPIETKTSPIFQTIDYRSTIDIGWIPDHGVDFFILFFIDLHDKWRHIFEQAELHLSNSRKTLLLNKGRTEDFIDNLLIDAQQWSNFRALLQLHVRTARNLLQDFREKRFLCDEVRESELLKVQRGEIVPAESGSSAPLRSGGAGPRNGVTSNQARANDEEKVYALDELARIIDRMETEVSEEITKLDQKTSELIELEFNLVSIYEARTSKLMGMSMKRLSWITFIFLPLMFVASLFGMNINILENNPEWWWAFVIGGSLFVFVIFCWILMKFIPEHYFQLDQWLVDFDRSTAAKKLWLLAKAPRINLRRKPARADRRRPSVGAADLELGRSVWEKGAVFSFEPPPRQWTSKLKRY